MVVAWVENRMGKGRTGNALPIELLPRLVEQIGVEPMTDNPMSSAHQKEAGKRADVELARSACVTPPLTKQWSRIEPLLPGPREPTTYGPLKTERSTQSAELATD